jgi:hypothetical protein
MTVLKELSHYTIDLVGIQDIIRARDGSDRR